MAKPIPLKSVADALKGFGSAMTAVSNPGPAPRPAPTVNAWPCDPAGDDYKIGPVIANNQHGIAGGDGLGGGGGRVKAITLTWEGIPWRIAEGAGALWVLVPDRGVVETHRPSLERLAKSCAEHGGGLAGAVSAQLTSRVRAPASSKPSAVSNKRAALNSVTLAVLEAYAAGASTQDVRLAVLSALGLDSDEAR